MNKGLSRLIAVALTTSAVAEKTTDFDETRREFEAFAAQLPYLDTASIINDLPVHSFSGADSWQRLRHFDVLRMATDQRHPKDALIHTLKNPDPRVRTLAAVALFDRDDPSVLPALVPLCHDQAPTFYGHGVLKESSMMPSGIGPPPLEQDVATIARRMVNLYMCPAGFAHGIESASNPGFKEYWAARKERSYCAGWFTVKLFRASHGTSRIYSDTISRIQAVRREIDQLPGDDRDWILLWLNGDMGSEHLVTESELVEACQRLGANKLLLMLQNRLPSDDPDLQPRSNSCWEKSRMVHFVLSHATQLFRSEDSEKLLRFEKMHRYDPTPLWAIAAASLRPDDASAILHDAMRGSRSKFLARDRAELCAAMWGLVGDIEGAYILDCFYGAQPEWESFTEGRRDFLNRVKSQPKAKEMMFRLIEDSRFDEIDWGSLVVMVRMINQWMGEPVVTEDDIRKVHHPLGEWSSPDQLSKAKESHPKETSDLLDQLRLWREKLRTCAPKLIEAEN